MKKLLLLSFVLAASCAEGIEDEATGGNRSDTGSAEEDVASDEDTGGASGEDTGGTDSSVTDTTTGATDTGATDTGATDTGPKDTGSTAKDTGTVVADTSTGGPLTGGPCISGTAGATAFRLRFYNGGGKATLAYDAWGLPDKSRQKAGVFGYSIGYTSPAYADPFLGEGGLPLDSSNFIDVELSTVGLSAVKSATLSIYGRSYNTTASGSFNWQTFKGTGATASGSMSNAAPYRWYPGNAAGAIIAGDGTILLRIKAGGPSGSIVVNKIELCMETS